MSRGDTIYSASSTDTIYSAALTYGRWADLGENLDAIIPRMLAELIELADEYAVDIEPVEPADDSVRVRI